MKRVLFLVFKAVMASVVLTAAVTIGHSSLGRAQGDPHLAESMRVTDEPLTITGELSAESEVLPQDGTYYNTHTFEGTAGQQITIDMVSNEFDTYLILFSPNGELIAQNDDRNGSNSRLVLTLPATGTYTIIANSYAPLEVGMYTIVLDSATSTDPVSPNVASTEAEALLVLASQQWGLGQVPAALQSLQQALVLFREANDREGEGIALSNLGTLYIQLEQHLQALELLQQALAIRREINDREGEAVTLNSLGGIYQELGEYARALEFFQQALFIRREVSDRRGEGITLGNIGAAYEALQQYSQALDFYQQSLEIRQEVDDRSGAGGLLILLGKTYILLGQYQLALEQYEQALIIFREIGDREGEASSLNGIGEVYNNLGQYPQALEYFQQSLTLFRTIEDLAGEAAVLNNMGTVYNALGQYLQEMEFYQQALQVLREIEHREGEAAVLANIAETYAFLGEYSQALDYYQQAQILFREIDNPLGEAAVLNGLGSIHRGQEQYGQARESYQKALALVENVGNQRLISNLLGNIGLVYQLQGQLAQALDYHQRSLAISRQINNRLDEIATLGNLSGLHWATGNVPLTLETLRQEAALREEDLSLILSIGSDSQKQAYMATIEGETSALITFHLQSAPDHPEATELAIATILQRKGRVLDAVTDNLQTLRQNLDADNQQRLDELQSIRSQLVALRFQGATSEWPETYQAELTRLEARAEDLANTLAQRSTEFRVESEPVRVAAVQSQIPADAVLVEFVRYHPFNPAASQTEQWGNPRYAAYILQPNGTTHGIDLGEADAIDQAIAKYLNQLQKPASLNAARAAGRTLDALILQPLRAHLGSAQHLLISPDGQLNLIPFAALVDENDQYLIENYTLTTLASGRDLIKLQLDIPSQQAPVILANPDFDAASTAIAQASRSNTRSTNTQRSIDLATLSFGALNGTQLEADAIVPLLPDATLLTGANATEAALTQVNAPSILHLATHGYFLSNVTPIVPSGRGDGTFETIPALYTPIPEDGTIRSSENPLLRSGLALANFNPPREESGNNDGVLSALEVSSLNLYGTDLVVLSACQTGVGDVVNGEGVYGLRRAFSIAGAESLLMSFWKVDDYGTAELMSLYYDRLINQNEGRSEALRQVQLELLNAPAYEHPYYWAAFTLSGDWQPLN